MTPGKAESGEPRTELERLLRRAGISINEFARALGRYPNTVWKVVAGEEEMTPSRAKRWAKELRAMGVEVEWKEILD